MDLSQPTPRTISILSCRGCNDSPNSSDGESSFTKRNQDERQQEMMKPTEDLLSSELNKLSLQERSKALEDLHCVGEELEETPDMILQSLEEFDQVVKAGIYPMYNQAISQNRAYVEDSSFRLMFLRANAYDAQKSVRQMVNHLHQKAQYFGEDKIARDIRLDDLNAEDIQVLLSGFLHVQGERDRTGRGILCTFSHLLGRWNHPSSQWTIQNVIRVHYYLMFHMLLPIPDVQTKGLVIVYYDSLPEGEKLSMPSIYDFVTMKAYRNTVPIRYSALHLCLKKEEKGLAFKNNFFQALLKNLTQYVRVRTRVHSGSNLETLYSLRSYGIPLDSFPVGEDGTIRTEFMLNAWFTKRAGEEARDDEDERFDLFSKDDEPFPIDETMGLPPPDDRMDSVVPDDPMNISVFQGVGHPGEPDPLPSAPAIPVAKDEPIQPLQQDILLGRGAGMMQHPGNIRFREFLELYQDKYDRAQRNRRGKVAAEVVATLTNQGVRFLQVDEHGDWVKSDPAKAEEKVGQLFRSRRKQSMKA
mmetsp:Transcript_31404/g.75726  ORF Transcript_31404/g.75726 Transcript_31404/m.75726 type:complete len:528 (+) Transcript_31404:81-1664(+)